jgi:hypothetical protein
LRQSKATPLKEDAGFSETSVHFYQITWLHVPEGSSVYRQQNLRSHSYILHLLGNFGSWRNFLATLVFEKNVVAHVASGAVLYRLGQSE